MTSTLDTTTPYLRPALTPRHRLPLRLHLLMRAVPVLATSMVGVALFVVWVTFVALSPLTIVAPLLVPITMAVRAFANAYRRDAHYMLGERLDPRYRPAPRAVLKRVWTIEKDPASWRDIAWCLLHAVVGLTAAITTLALFFGGVFYLIYPFLYWVTPHAAFGRPFGGLVDLHSVAQSCALMPLALVSFGLWWALSVPLARAELALTRSLLGRR